MDNETLSKANALKDRIKQLQAFIDLTKGGADWELVAYSGEPNSNGVIKGRDGVPRKLWLDLCDKTQGNILCLLELERDMLTEDFENL